MMPADFRETLRSELLQRGAPFAEPHGLPIIRRTDLLPQKIITFSTAINPNCTEYDSWVCFYEWDWKFAPLWRNPYRCLERLRLFQGVLSPDNSLSIYADGEEQLEQIYLARLMAGWFQANGIPVIANVRYANRQSRPFCCEGVPRGAAIAIGTLGSLKNPQLRQTVVEGLSFICETLSPQRLLVYGGCPDNVFERYRRQGVQVIPYEDQTTVRHREARERRRRERERRLDALHGRLL